MGLFFHKKKPSANIYQIPRGDDEIEVYGDQYRSRIMARLYSRNGTHEFLVSITTISAYQITHNWPNPPFVNVNTFGSRTTEKDNWLGYIPFGYGNIINFPKIIGEHDEIAATARIEKRGNSLELILMVNRENPEITEIEARVEHKTEIEQRAVAIIANHTDKINVDLVSEKWPGKKYKGQEFFVVKFHGHKIGELSMIKSREITKYLDGKPYSAVLNLRYNQYSDHNDHYSSMIVYRK